MFIEYNKRMATGYGVRGVGVRDYDSEMRWNTLAQFWVAGGTETWGMVLNGQLR
jgi:hypothetical protein